MRGILITSLTWLAWPGIVAAQDLEPRRWTHMPVGTNVGGLAYAYTDGELKLDPVLEIEDGEVETHQVLASYVRTFDLLGKTGRLDVIVPWAASRWEGLLAGNPASTRRHGMGDPWVRFSVNLRGGPALKGKEYMAYRAAHPVHTMVGAAVSVMLPLGEYQEDKLLNLGQNRFILRPQVGVVHTRGPWAYELTSSAFFYTDNDEFFGDTTREQDPVYAFQGHVVHTFPNQTWVSGSAGYNWGGESEIDGVPRDDERGDFLYALSTGIPVGKTQALKLVYLRGDTQERVGTDTNTLILSWTVRF